MDINYGALFVLLALIFGLCLFVYKTLVEINKPDPHGIKEGRRLAQTGRGDGGYIPTIDGGGSAGDGGCGGGGGGD